MAKVNFGAGITDMRGKIGGTAFSRNKSGAYARAKVTGTNPSTVYQTTVRTLFNNVATAWRTLTDVQRQTFIDQAPSYSHVDVFGNTIQYSGQQLFMHLNVQRLNVGDALLTTCTPATDVEGITGGLATVAIGAGTLEISDLSANVAGTKLVIEATAPMSAGVANAGTKYRSIVVNQTIVVGVADIKAAWEAKFGTIATVPVGSKVFFRWFNVSDTNGQSSAYNSAVAVAQA